MDRFGAVTTVAIANNTATSAAIDGRGYAMFAVILPAAFTGASITFTVCDTIDGTYQELRKADADSAVSVTVTQGKSYDLPVQLAPWPFWKIVSASNEGAARTLTVVMKP